MGARYSRAPGDAQVSLNVLGGDTPNLLANELGLKLTWDVVVPSGIHIPQA